MDLFKTPVWIQIIELLAKELETQIKVGGTLYGNTPRFQDIRVKKDDKPYETIPGVKYYSQIIENIPITVGPFKTEEKNNFDQEMAQARKTLPIWRGHYQQLINLTIQNAIIASQQLMSRRKTPDNERLLFSYWQNLRQAKNIQQAIQITIEFLASKFRAGNVTLTLYNYQAELFALNPTLKQAELRIINQMRDTKTPCIVNMQKDLLLNDLRNKENLPNCVTALPIIKERELLGCLMLYGDEPLPIEQITEIMNEFTESLRKLSEYEQVQESAVTDVLTGLSNRTLLAKQLDELLQELASNKEPVSIMMLDADNFKNYNDTYGHPEGDKVLKTISRVIKSLVPENALVCRYGGEEFLIALPQLDQHQAKSFAELLRTTIQKESPLTVSIGMVVCLNSSGTKDKLIRLADEALYRAKQFGKNKVMVKIMLDKYLSVIDA